MKNALATLCKSLMRLHKSLLDFQSQEAEREDNRKYGPYELLQMSLEDPRFQWFRKFSQLIVQADIRSSDKIDPGTLEVPAILDQLNKLLTDPDFLKRYNLAMMSDPLISAKKDEVTRDVAEIQRYLN